MLRADERWDDDDDGGGGGDDETKNRHSGGITGRVGIRAVYGGVPEKNGSIRPHSKSCHLVTSCLFSTSHRPEGNKQRCRLIENRCYEWDRDRESHINKERQTERETWRRKRGKSIDTDDDRNGF